MKGPGQAVAERSAARAAITVHEAAAILQLTADQVGYLCDHGGLECLGTGLARRVDRESLEGVRLQLEQRTAEILTEWGVTPHGAPAPPSQGWNSVG